MGPDVIPVKEVIAAWSEDPAYRVAYDALEGEFALASAMIQTSRPARPYEFPTGRSSQSSRRRST